MRQSLFLMICILAFYVNINSSNSHIRQNCKSENGACIKYLAELENGETLTAYYFKTGPMAGKYHSSKMGFNNKTHTCAFEDIPDDEHERHFKMLEGDYYVKNHPRA